MNRMIKSRVRKYTRRGATVTETALILSMFLVLTMGLLDLGVGVFRYNILAESARFTARRAIVHGAKASTLGAWGPTTIESAANGTGIPAINDATEGIANKLVGCDLSSTQVRVEWPDGDNQPGDRVKVTVTSPYQPSLTWIFPNGQIMLTARTTMLIAH